MLTTTCMYWLYIDTNNPQGMQLGEFKNRTPARFEYIYCTLFPLCHSNEDMHPFLKDASFSFVHTIAQFCRILRFSHIYCQFFRIRKILKFWRTELSYAQIKNRGKKMRLLWMDICPSLNNIMKISCNKCTRSEQGYDF
jgi:hypothetical protein